METKNILKGKKEGRKGVRRDEGRKEVKWKEGRKESRQRVSSEMEEIKWKEVEGRKVVRRKKRK